MVHGEWNRGFVCWVVQIVALAGIGIERATLCPCADLLHY